MAKDPLGEPQLRGLAQRIGGYVAEVQEPEESLDRLKAEFLLAAREDALAQVPAQAWDRLPNVLSHGTAPRLIDEQTIMAGLASHVSERRSNRCVRNLAAYYFREFEGKFPPFSEAASILRGVFLDQARRYPRWALAQDRYSLFEPTLGPGMAAEQCLFSSSPIDAVLEDVGAPAGSITSRFGIATLYAGLALVAETLALPSAKQSARGYSLDQLRPWLEKARSLSALTLGVQSEIALRMLEPWEGRRPGGDLRQFLVDLILEYVGDPRDGGVAWQLPELQSVKETLMGWLAYGTIERFFSIIDASAEAGHWNDRRAFWASYADKGVVTDAWVAYGPVAYRLAQQSGDSSLRFGQLLNARLRDHSALLLRIGALVVADYSHNGSCRFYNSSNWQPSFYRPTYNDADLRGNATDWFGHHSGWQWKFAQYIRRATGAGSNYEGSV
jgi:hypothetical protein